MAIKKDAPKFTKQQFLESNRYTQVEKDIMTALLDDKLTYSLEEVNQILDGFRKKEVK